MAAEAAEHRNIQGEKFVPLATSQDTVPDLLLCKWVHNIQSLATALIVDLEWNIGFPSAIFYYSTNR